MFRVPVKKVIALTAVASLGTALSGCGTASEESSGAYPEKEITWVVPYDAGGNTDAISRTVAEVMGKELDTDIVVENKPGGSGAIGMREIQGAKPDGYTIGLFTTGTMVVTPTVNDVGYGLDDFDNVGLMLTQPVIFMTSAKSQYSTWDELAAAAKKNPTDLTIGVPGATTPQAYEISRMASEYDTKFTTVPFDSNAEVVAALRGGNIDAIALNASDDVVAQLKSGDLEPLAVGEAERLPWLPDTPTLSESGLDDLTASGTYIGLTAPADLPDDVLSELEDALKATLETEKVQKFLGEANVPDEFVGSKEITELLQERTDLYADLID